MRRVRVTSPRPSGSGDRRVIHKLGRNVGVRLSSPLHHGESLTQVASPSVSGPPDSSRLAQTTVVQRPDGAISRGPVSVTQSVPDAQAAAESSISQPPRVSQSARLVAEKQALRDRGFSSAAAQRIVAPQRASTLSVYEGKWKVFVDWCGQRGDDPFQASSPLVADFLLYLFRVRQLKPATIEGYRTALAGALRHRLDLGKDRELSALIQSFFHQKPRVRRSIPFVGFVSGFSCLTRELFEPLKTTDL